MRILLTSALLCVLCRPLPAAERPNVVVILADDMGYGDVQALNPDSKIPTPNLNRLAADGMTFTDAHTGSAVCTPTRYGLVTGRYCWRTRLTSGVLNGYGEPLMDQSRQTIADFLGGQGYHTGIVGKWHLGLGFAKDGQDFDFSKPVSDGPHTHGFAFSHIIPASLDFPPYVYIRNGEITKFPSVEQAAVSFPKFLRKGERGPDLIMEEVLDELARQAGGYIERQSKTEQPFFLYVPLTAPHKPVWPHPRFVGMTDLGPYGDFVTQVDATVGDILKSIDEAGVRDETLVIYTSDNGSFMRRSSDPNFVDHVLDETVQEYRETHHTANGPFRGTKADIYEAGHHVPFFARWPGNIEAGSEMWRDGLPDRHFSDDGRHHRCRSRSGGRAGQLQPVAAHAGPHLGDPAGAGDSSLGGGHVRHSRRQVETDPRQRLRRPRPAQRQAV